MKRGSLSVGWIFLSAGLCLYAASIVFQGTVPYKDSFQSGGLPPAAQQVLAGPFAGVASDLNIMNVFSIYDEVRKHPDDDDLLWVKLHQRLLAAQTLDPWFWDVYRLTTGLMGFHKQGTAAAVEILAKGSEARYWDWETPFIAGYLAHDILHDDKRAYELMRIAVERPNAPSLAIGLAARFLQSSKDTAASLQFLHQLKASMPPQYRGAIDARIKKLTLEHPVQ